MRKQKQRGALFIEYALVLAFVIGVGVLFLENNFQRSITGVFERVELLIATSNTRDSKFQSSFAYAINNITNKPYKSIYICEDHRDSNQINRQASAKELDKLIKDVLTDADKENLAYWSVNRYKDETEPTYRYAWSSYNTSEMAPEEYMPVIRYSKNETTNTWEYQVAEMKIYADNSVTNGIKNKIEWGNDSDTTKNLKSFATEKEALAYYNKTYSDRPL